MATFIYFFVTLINPESKSSFITCWFPDSSSIREFKQIACDELKSLEVRHVVLLSLLLDLAY